MTYIRKRKYLCELKLYNDSSGWMSLNFSRELLCTGENSLLYDKNLDTINYGLNHLVTMSLSLTDFVCLYTYEF